MDPDYEVLGRAAVTVEDIRTFRQLGSRCPGHPEYRWTSGVEATTGPLGQGVATSVGMAVAGQWLGARYNREGFALPSAVRARVAVEQAATLGWDRYVGDAGAVIGMHTFGASAPLKQLQTKFGFTPDWVARARELLAGGGERT